MTHGPAQGSSQLFLSSKNPFRLEVYLEAPSVEQMVAVAAAGVSQVELADQGATTPSLALLQQARILMPDVFIQPIVNTGAQGFVYTPLEIKEQASFIRHAYGMGANGFVVGCLKEGAKVDPYALETLVQAAESAPVTFHSAFDEIDPSRQVESIAALAGAGIKTIMTAGGKNGRLSTHINSLVETQKAAARFGVSIMARGGIELSHLQDPAILERLRGFAGVHARFNDLGEKSFSPNVYKEAGAAVRRAGLAVFQSTRPRFSTAASDSSFAF